MRQKDLLNLMTRGVDKWPSLQNGSEKPWPHVNIFTYLSSATVYKPHIVSVRWDEARGCIPVKSSAEGFDQVGSLHLEL